MVEQIKQSGCSIYPNCLECPLEACRYDVPLPQQQYHSRQRAILGMLKLGRSVLETANLLGVSERTVYRVRQEVLYASQNPQSGS